MSNLLPVGKAIEQTIYYSLETLRKEYELSEREIIGQASLHLTSRALEGFREFLKDLTEEKELQDKLQHIKEANHDKP